MRYRKRDARHPIVLASMGGLSYIAVSQLWFGPEGSSVVQNMGHSSQQTFAWLMLGSAVTCAVSALIGRPPHSPKWKDTRPLGAKIEAAGMFGLAVALFFYSGNLPETLPGDWNTSMALAFFATGLGAIVRAGLVWRMIRHKETW